MKAFLPLLVILLLFGLAACPYSSSSDSNEAQTQEADLNPPAPGFNLAQSDEQAIAIADSVMTAMGGRKAWDNTRFLQWTFFGRRQLLWDKQNGRVRISMDQDSTLYLLDLQSKTGKIRQDGERVEHPDSLAKYLEIAESIWINDSYWLVMPFKLKDSGVTLAYQGIDTTQFGLPAHLLQLTFQEVGKTPENKYHVLVDPKTYHVVEWRYFPQASDTEPALTTPWLNYRRYGQILLSGDRGRAKLSDIHVWKEVPEQAFSDLDFQWK